MGVNHMTVWTDAERKAMNGLKRSSVQPDIAPEPFVDEGKGIPDKVDWRTAYPPVLTGVKDQGQCGSCWTFGSTEAMESHFALLTGQLPTLSEQMMLETPNPDQCGGTGGCGGGTAPLAYSWIVSGFKGGLASEWTYPYASYFGQNCTLKNSACVRHCARLSSVSR